jgi:nucleoside-diphosphate kinase
MDREKTLVICKHDAVSRGLVGEIIMRFERIGLKLLAFEMISATKDMGNRHYPNTDEWKKKVGLRTLDEYNEKNVDPIEKLGTDDPIKIGEMVKQWNIEYLTAGPVVAMVWEGPNAVRIVRKLVGNTVPALAEPGTIRGDYSWDSAELANDLDRPFYNLIHASGDVEEAKDEIALWFDEIEVFDYEVFDSEVMGLKKKLLGNR